MADHWPEIQTAGYGALELKPWELGRLTPAEYGAMIAGYNWRQERYWQNDRLLAWNIAALSRVENPPTFEEFVTRENKPEPTHAQTWQEMKAEMKVFARAMNQGRG